MCFYVSVWCLHSGLTRGTTGQITTEIRSVSLRSSGRYLSGKNVARGKSDKTAICASTKRGAHSTSATIGWTPRNPGCFSRSARLGRGSPRKSRNFSRLARLWSTPGKIGNTSRIDVMDKIFSCRIDFLQKSTLSKTSVTNSLRTSSSMSTALNKRRRRGPHGRSGGNVHRNTGSKLGKLLANNRVTPAP